MADLVLLSPLRLHTTPQSSRKRKITPSAEESSPKRSVLITPPDIISSSQIDLSSQTYPSPLYLPHLSSQAKIDARLSFDTQSPESEFQPLGSKPFTGSNSLSQPNILPARHIALSFDLRTQQEVLDFEELSKLLSHIFPGLSGIGYDWWFLYLQLNAFPPKPWPKTIAGLPCYFTRDIGSGDTPMPRGLTVSFKNPRIAQEINGKDLSNWEPLFLIIKDYFQSIEVLITEVFYWGNYFTVVLERRDTVLSQLPRTVAQMPVRMKDPEIGRPDDSKYDTLQPGIRLTSGYNPDRPGEFLETTAGVLVQDSMGNNYMTVAFPGFLPERGSIVYHPSPVGGRQIGELIVEVTHTDVALVKLNDNETFTNISFQNDVLIEPVQLKQFIEGKSIQRLTIIMLDSPDTGYIEGNFMSTSFSRIPDDDPFEPKQQWVFTEWLYMGQDALPNLPDGMCGSTIWREDSSIIGFFRYAANAGPMEGWCCAVAADKMIKDTQWLLQVHKSQFLRRGYAIIAATGLAKVRNINSALAVTKL